MLSGNFYFDPETLGPIITKYAAILYVYVAAVYEIGTNSVLGHLSFRQGSKDRACAANSLLQSCGCCTTADADAQLEINHASFI